MMENETNTSGRKTIQERVAQVYYTHGLFCASHPYAVFCTTLFVFGFCCYPLLSYQLTGNAPLEYTIPLATYSNKSTLEQSYNSTLAPRWYKGEPLGYIQQIIVKSAVSPWQDNLIPSDAFRSPLSTVFSLLETINNYQLDNGSDSVSLADLCSQISEITSKLPLHLSRYSCLLISPSNIWSQDFLKFQADANLVATVFRNMKNWESYNFNINEIFFGVAWVETGLKKYYMRSRQRVIKYAITVVFKEYNQQYIQGLKNHLMKIYKQTQNVNSSAKEEVTQIHYETQYHVIEFLPLAVAYVILFLYIYFSVRKIEHVKSKWALAMSAVTTVIASLLMSVSLCARFGLSFTLNGGEVFPYLVVIIGLENMLVITNSIVSTPPYLDVKIRVAQGLSKEGWSITKNLLTELCILTIGFFTFVPAIQEFCMFAVVGFLTDFFLQLVFFSTILSIDIRGMELSDMHHHGLYNSTSSYPMSMQDPIFRCPVTASTKLCRSKSAPKLHSNVMAHGTRGSSRTITSKRVRFIYFWARTRMVQRVFMVSMVVWISIVIYKFFVLGYLTHNVLKRPSDAFFHEAVYDKHNMSISEHNVSSFAPRNIKMSDARNGKSDLLHHGSYNWRTLSNKHWPTLFGLYNISIYGRYVSLLPPIELSMYMSPEDAVQLRHPEEIHIADKLKSLWSKDKGWMSKFEDGGVMSQASAFYEASENDMLLLCIVAIPSVVLLIYVMVVLYRCVCNRNYAEWRSSWHRDDWCADEYSETVHVETLPKTLSGHKQDVECIAVNTSSSIASSCLAGEIRVWDSTTGECLTIIQRSTAHQDIPPTKIIIDEQFEPALNLNNENNSSVVYSSHHPYCENRKESNPRLNRRVLFSGIPDLSGNIYTNFANNKTHHGHANNAPHLPFQNYRELLHEHKKKLDSCKNESDKISDNSRRNHIRSLSMGQSPYLAFESSQSQPVIGTSQQSAPIWCLDFESSLIVAGCADGSIEFWNSFSGQLCFINNQNPIGITAIKIVGNLVIAARLSGCVDLIVIESSNNCEETLNNSNNIYNRGTNSGGRRSKWSPSVYDDSNVIAEDMFCKIYHSFHAHQQPISIMNIEGGRIITGSNDKTLKVIRLEDGCCLFTLHGHSGAITALHVDKLAPTAAASGSEDGSVCMWDLMTGACIYQLNGHPRGCVLALLYTHTHVISSGTDNRICIWERQQGHLLHSLHLLQSYCDSIMMLTSNILVTARQGSLVLWDINEGEPIRIIHLGNSDSFISVHQMKYLNAAVVVDYGKLLKVIPFPIMTERIS